MCILRLVYIQGYWVSFTDVRLQPAAQDSHLGFWHQVLFFFLDPTAIVFAFLGLVAQCCQIWSCHACISISPSIICDRPAVVVCCNFYSISCTFDFQTVQACSSWNITMFSILKAESLAFLLPVHFIPCIVHAFIFLAFQCNYQKNMQGPRSAHLLQLSTHDAMPTLA